MEWSTREWMLLIIAIWFAGRTLARDAQEFIEWLKKREGEKDGSA